MFFSAAALLDFFIQEVFSDFCDASGFLPKGRVGDAVRCLGENPLQSEVSRVAERLETKEYILQTQISELTKKYTGQGITFEQFQEIVKICKSQNQSPTDEVLKYNLQFLYQTVFHS